MPGKPKPKSNTYPEELPSYPFQRVGADLFEFQSVHYLLVVDYYSKWPGAVPLRSLNTKAVTSEMERIFADFGVPEELRSDNGPQFGSAEFRQFCRKVEVRHTTSSPEYPQSNGLAERTVQTVKQRLLKLFQEGQSLWQALAAIRSTPVSPSLPSPAVLLQGRNLRGSLPFVESALRPKVVSPEVVKQKMQERKLMTNFTSARKPDSRSSCLRVGQPVRVRVNRKWVPGTVNKACELPNSYVVRTLDGRLFRRNRTAINAIRVPVEWTLAEKRATPVDARTPHEDPEGETRERAETPSGSQKTPVTEAAPQQASQPEEEESPFHGFPSAPPPGRPAVQPNQQVERVADAVSGGGRTRSGCPYLGPQRLV